MKSIIQLKTSSQKRIHEEDEVEDEDEVKEDGSSNDNELTINNDYAVPTEVVRTKWSESKRAPSKKRVKMDLEVEDASEDELKKLGRNFLKSGEGHFFFITRKNQALIKVINKGKMSFLRKRVIDKLVKKGGPNEKATYQYIFLLHQPETCDFQVNDKSDKRFNLDLVRCHVVRVFFDFYCTVCVENGCTSHNNNRRNMKWHLLSHKWKNDPEEKNGFVRNKKSRSHQTSNKMEPTMNRRWIMHTMMIILIARIPFKEISSKKRRRSG